MIDALAAALLGVPVVTGAACWLARRGAAPPILSTIGTAAVLVVGLSLAVLTSGGAPVRALYGLALIDSFSALLLATVVVISAGALLYSVDYVQRDVAAGLVAREQVGLYYLLFHLMVAAMAGICLANNLGVVWVFIEATTVVSALLVGFYQTATALEAAWKYVVLCTVGITLALFGLVLIYYAAGPVVGLSEGALDWETLRAAAGQLDHSLVRLALVFIVVGYGTKAGFAPLHAWLPDAYSQAPAPVSAVLSGALLPCVLYAIVRVVTVLAPGGNEGFAQGLLLLFGLLSVLIATPFILVQRDIKRLLGYSSIEHVGLMAIGFGLGGSLAVFGALLHIVNHSLVKAMLFMATGNLSQRFRTRQMGRIRGAGSVMRFSSMVFALGVLALGGSPPFNVFVSELAIIQGGFQGGHLLVTLLVVLLALAVFGGLVYHAGAMVFGRAPERIGTGELGRLNALLLGVPAVAVVWLGLVVPEPLGAAVSAAARVLTQGR